MGALALALVAGGAGPGAGDVTMAHPSPPPSGPAAAAPAAATPALPAKVAGWTRAGAARRIEPAAIFEYMDGAGELYLAYRLDHLDVVEYRSAAAGDLLVELYWMGSSDDAFGLLSGDWGGEAVDLGGAGAPPQAGWPRALYGGGLLRLWSDNLYARVFASRESDDARHAVLALGRMVVQGRATPAPPALADRVAAAAALGFAARRDRLCFFRSHFVLNSAYFLSQRDLLGLGPAVDAVVAPFDRAAASGVPKARATVVTVRYPSAADAKRALARFRQGYLGDDTGPGVRRIEDGWAGSRLAGRGAALVFEAPDRAAAEALLAAAAAALHEEVPHE